LVLLVLLLQVYKEPKEVAEERRAEAAEANAARRKEQQEKNESKKRMKGKNKPTRRQKKKQLNVIEVLPHRTHLLSCLLKYEISIWSSSHDVDITASCGSYAWTVSQMPEFVTFPDEVSKRL
jgi:hypothetical protein